MNRKEWDKASITKEAENSICYEKDMLLILESIFKGYPAIVTYHKRQNDRHDMCITFPFVNLEGDNKSTTVHIEYECGTKQPQWCDHIQDNIEYWTMGLNVLDRKLIEGKHFDIFLKGSMSGNSFFASTYEFALRVGIPGSIRGNSLKYKTCETVHSIPWNIINIPSTEFCYDDFSKLRYMIALCAKNKC